MREFTNIFLLPLCAFSDIITITVIGGAFRWAMACSTTKVSTCPHFALDLSSLRSFLFFFAFFLLFSFTQRTSRSEDDHSWIFLGPRKKMLFFFQIFIYFKIPYIMSQPQSIVPSSVNEREEKKTTSNGYHLNNNIQQAHLPHSGLYYGPYDHIIISTTIYYETRPAHCTPQSDYHLGRNGSY